jgi:Second Messenger Oligonucleotide or Dinucleotide Synthetase domain
MGGGGARWTPERVDDIKRDLDKIKKNAEASTFSTEIANYLSGLLASANDRRTELIKDRLDTILTTIRAETEGTVTVGYAGSVAKHTDVSGLSDIDVLLNVKGSELNERGPASVRERVASLIRSADTGAASVKVGRLAVTVTFPDGMEIQLLPALKTRSGLKIPSAAGTRWSDINPDGFLRALSKANSSLSGKLMPTIKLIKAVNDNLPGELQLSGYHIESAALEAFKGYKGPRTPAAMLEHFFSKAPEIVKTPIKDRTGQSFHVDDDLGPANSDKRQLLSSTLDRIARRISFATVSKDLRKLQDLFD